MSIYFNFVIAFKRLVFYKIRPSFQTLKLYVVVIVEIVNIFIHK